MSKKVSHGASLTHRLTALDEGLSAKDGLVPVDEPSVHSHLHEKIKAIPIGSYGRGKMSSGDEQPVVANMSKK